MKSALIFLIVIILSTGAFAFFEKQADITTQYAPNVTEVIHLELDNFVALNKVVTDRSSSKLIFDIMSNEHERIYLYLYTPGGSIVAGNKIITVMDTLISQGKEIICIADFAASMGFGIFQACSERLVMPSSQIMQHQMSLGVRGQVENIRTLLNTTDEMYRELVVRQADRVGLSYDDFMNKIAHDWWMYGDDAVFENAADRMVHVNCSPELVRDTYEVEEKTMFGYEIHVYSSCPLITAPLEIRKVTATEVPMFNPFAEQKDDLITGESLLDVIY